MEPTNHPPFARQIKEGGRRLNKKMTGPLVAKCFFFEQANPWFTQVEFTREWELAW